MRQHRFAKQLRLPRAIVAPDLQHDVSTTSGAIFLDLLHALVGRARNGTDFAQHFIADGLRGGFAAAFFHGVRNRLQLFESDARGFAAARPLSL